MSPDTFLEAKSEIDLGAILSFEAGVRAAAGNTNYAVAVQKVQEFDAARDALGATP